MSDTNKKSNSAIACGNMKVDDKGIILDQKNYGPSRYEINQLTGVEIRFDEESIVTNETENGKIAMINKKTGEVIGYLDQDGTINRKLSERDRKEQGMKEDLEH